MESTQPEAETSSFSIGFSFTPRATQIGTRFGRLRVRENPIEKLETPITYTKHQYGTSIHRSNIYGTSIQTFRA